MLEREEKVTEGERGDRSVREREREGERERCIYIYINMQIVRQEDKHIMGLNR